MTQLKSERTRRREEFRRHINQVLENREDSADDEWWEDDEAAEELDRLACAGSDYASNSDRLKIGSGEKLILAVYKGDSGALFKQIEAETDKVMKNPDGNGIHLLFFVHGMRKRMQLEKRYAGSFGKRLENRIRTGAGGKNLSLKVTYVLVQEYKKQDIELKNIKRFEMLQMPALQAHINREPAEEGKRKDSDGNALCSLVFTVDLFQLVEIYNLIGDRLFRNNVRFGINEMLGVDRAICETLEKEPEYFWYKNNGITILIENRPPDLRGLETLLLDRVVPDREPVFSVINGAQTITASARYFFETERAEEDSQDSAEQKRLEEKLEKFKRAEVLVRVIYISEKDAGKTVNVAREISTALNRQKPVKIEDIAFTVRFVEKLAGYLERNMENGRTDFCLARRGEGLIKSRQMDLISFARARKACICEPGEARSQGGSVLLKFRVDDKDGEYRFQQEDIFPNEWLRAGESEEEEVFRRFYGAVWFADRLARRYDKIKKDLKKEEGDVSIVIQNGKWYFVAILVQLLNGFSAADNVQGMKMQDFSKFRISLSEIEERLWKGIPYFAKMLVRYHEVHTEYGKLDSNFFKKSDCCKVLVRDMKQVWYAGQEEAQGADDEAAGWMMRFMDLFREVIPEKGEKEQQSEPALPGGHESYVILDGKRFPVKSKAEALQRMTEYILIRYPQVREMLWDNTSNWLIPKQKQIPGPEGYFRNVREITAGGRVYQVGTSSNTKMKCYQLQTLCRLAGAGKGEIIWYHKDSAEPVFSWQDHG